MAVNSEILAKRRVEVSEFEGKWFRRNNNRRPYQDAKLLLAYKAKKIYIYDLDSAK